jgi:hypothetical protein
MKLKEDAMNNKETKPAYNLQIATEKQFITNFELYPNPNDIVTLIPFLKLHKSRYEKMPQKVIADAGYGSEENFAFMTQNQIDAYVKYNHYNKEQTNDFKNNPFLIDNLYYNEEEDYFLCPMGTPLLHKGTGTKISENGYHSPLDIYQAQNCQECLLQGKCVKSGNNRRIDVNHALRTYKKKIRELLVSKEGALLYKQRSIEPEPVFGQMKYNKNYKRFRHVSKEKVTMDFAIFAIAFNLGKMWNKDQKSKKKNKNNAENQLIFIFILPINETEIVTQKRMTQIRNWKIRAA